jgi:integrase
MAKHKLFRRKPGGNWYVWLKGERVSTGRRDRKAAELEADELERRSADPTYRAAHETTLRAALRGFIDARAALGRSGATLAFYERLGRHLTQGLGADTPLARLERGAVLAYVAAREGAQGASAHTVHKEIGLLRAALRWARAGGFFPKPPESVLPSDHADGYEPRRGFLTHGEAWALVHHVAQAGGQSQPLALGRSAHVAFLLGTGARWGESLRAEPGDVDLRRGVVQIRGTKTAASAAPVPLLPLTRPFVEYALAHADGPGRRFFRPWGNVRRDLHRACGRAGVAPLGPNDFRRSLATWLVRAGVPLELVAEVLRHKSTAMVHRVYGVRDAASTGRAIEGYLARRAGGG